MSTYTTLTLESFNRLIQPLGFKPAQALIPVAAGIENSTYFIKRNPARQEWVLTIFENRSFNSIARILKWQHHLHQQHLPIAKIVYPTIKKVQTPFRIDNKPGALFEKLPGQHIKTAASITPEMRSLLGATLAKIHQSTLMNQELHQQFKLPNDRGWQWLLQQSPLTSEDRALYQQIIHLLKQHEACLKYLPSCMIHGDLFPDNCLFDQEQLIAVIDFDNACSEVALFDLAIAYQAWHPLDALLQKSLIWSPQQSSFLASYDQHRPLIAAEKAAWPIVQVWAAARFWLSRIIAQHNQQSLPKSKPPEHYQVLLHNLLDKSNLGNDSTKYKGIDAN